MNKKQYLSMEVFAFWIPGLNSNMCMCWEEGPQQQ